MNRRIVLMVVFACFLAALIARVEAQRSTQSGAVQVRPDAIGGVVTSSKGPEAGVWVIAETTDLPTKYAKIVVTDDQGRYLVPQLPRATYRLWVRGYGLVDSPKTTGSPGKRVNLKAVIAPTAKDAAQYYPADYWYSLIQVPDKSEFPMKPTPAPPYQVPRSPTAAQPSGGATPNQNVEFLAAGRVIENQHQWLDVMKQGCEICHQIGDWATRDLTHLDSYHFKSIEEAWATRLLFSQKGAGMRSVLARFVDQQRAIAMFADWSKRIAAGEVPPVPPRPQGAERNVVITMWDWGADANHVHDEIATDKRNPTVNAKGLVYAVDYDLDTLLTVDPVENKVTSTLIPTLADKSTMRPTYPQGMAVPSPFYGDKIIWPGVDGPHNPMLDQKGRLWITTNIRPADNPKVCQEGSDNPFAKYFPMKQAQKHVALYDSKTKQFSLVDTCFSTHHLQMAEDKDNTMFFSSPGGQAFGWINSRVLDETGDGMKAQGWCPAYLDTNGNGKADPGVDKRIDTRGYGIAVNPVDGSVWQAQTGPTPGHLLRVSVGSHPPETCLAEVYEPPYYNPKAPGVFGYGPRGVDVDRDGVVWTALSGSSQLASFDRRKCAVLNGPTATGQHCPEGWTLYTTPGPKMKGVTDDMSADMEYYNWVDQHNTLGLGENISIVTGSTSDSLEAFLPREKKWVVMRVPYPMGFFARGLDGRIDDPNGGWKGRGVWAAYGTDVNWHVEGGPGTLSKAVHFQIRPNPLAE